MPEVLQTKTCTKCQEGKPLDQFHTCPNTKDRLRPECKECLRRRASEYYRANRKRRLESMRKWAGKNRERVAVYKKKHCEENPHLGRNSKLRRNYGLSPEDYQSLFSAQGGVCAICGNPETRRSQAGKVRTLCVDHEHASGRVRGLLCSHCNSAVGSLMDDPDLMRQAALYVERSMAPAVRLA